MSREKFDYLKGYAITAFQDAATMPFRAPDAIYRYKISQGFSDDRANDLRKEMRDSILASCIPAIGLGVCADFFLGLPAALITAVAIPYAFVLVPEILVEKTMGDGSEEKKALEETFWPKLTAFKDSFGPAAP